MKKLLTLLALLALTLLPLRAADYAVQKTITNAPVISFANAAQLTINQAVDVTQVGDFALSVFSVSSTAVSGAAPLAVKWQTSLDGVNWNATTNDAPGRAQGWFHIPASTGGGFTNYWVTNITVDAIGYWRVANITNTTGQSITNLVVRGYVKPKRSNRDY
jgi:hypothetical protein